MLRPITRQEYQELDVSSCTRQFSRFIMFIKGLEFDLNDGVLETNNKLKELCAPFQCNVDD